MKVVDPHIHLWDLATGLYPALEKPSTSFIGNNEAIARTYLLEELLGEGRDEIEITKIVHVEAFPTDRFAETAYLQDLADRTGCPNGLVVNVDLAAVDAEFQLEKQCVYKNVRGIRQVLNRHDNQNLTYGAADHLHNPDWVRNFGRLSSRNLSFDMQLYPHQIEDVIPVLAANPGVPVILNHAGMFCDRTLDSYKVWKRGLKILSDLPHVCVKISGLGMFDHHWTVDSFRPVVFEVLEAFGTQRSMFASNFPVDKLFGTYEDIWLTFAQIVSDFSADEKHALMVANAERIYRI